VEGIGKVLVQFEEGGCLDDGRDDSGVGGGAVPVDLPEAIVVCRSVFNCGIQIAVEMLRQGCALAWPKCDLLKLRAITAPFDPESIVARL